MNQEEVLNPIQVPITNKKNLIYRIVLALLNYLGGINCKSKCCYESECNSSNKPIDEDPPF